MRSASPLTVAEPSSSAAGPASSATGPSASGPGTPVAEAVNRGQPTTPVINCQIYLNCAAGGVNSNRPSD